MQRVLYHFLKLSKLFPADLIKIYQHFVFVVYDLYFGFPFRKENSPTSEKRFAINPMTGYHRNDPAG